MVRTLASYQHGVEAYLADSLPTPSADLADFRRTVAALLPLGSRMLELGSGPGHDALFFEANRVEVHRTDGTPAFVDRLRADGHQARVLDITCDEFGGPYDIIFANAVLLHLTASQLDDVFAKTARAVAPRGLFAFTVKEGDGEAWSTAKLKAPRYFHYWREPLLRERLELTGWQPVEVRHIRGRTEPWLHVICRRRGGAGSGGSRTTSGS